MTDDRARQGCYLVVVNFNYILLRGTPMYMYTFVMVNLIWKKSMQLKDTECLIQIAVHSNPLKLGAEQ